MWFSVRTIDGKEADPRRVQLLARELRARPQQPVVRPEVVPSASAEVRKEKHGDGHTCWCLRGQTSPAATPLPRVTSRVCPPPEYAARHEPLRRFRLCLSRPARAPREGERAEERATSSPGSRRRAREERVAAKRALADVPLAPLRRGAGRSPPERDELTRAFLDEQDARRPSARIAGLDASASCASSCSRDAPGADVAALRAGAPARDGGGASRS